MGKEVGKCLRPGLIGSGAMVANRWDKSRPTPTAQYHCIYEVVEDGSHAVLPRYSRSMYV